MEITLTIPDALAQLIGRAGDDQAGVTVARRQGLAMTGTLGVLDIAARRGLVDLAAAFARLKATSFYYRQGLFDALLAQHRKGEEG